MSAMPQHESHMKHYRSTATYLRGAVGGLVGTVVMDLFGLVLFLALGGPASLSVSIIGDAAAEFSARIGVFVEGGAPLGALLHYLIGVALGIILSAAILRIEALQALSTRRLTALSVLYVEIMSLPMLATAAILLTMTSTQTVQWFGISFVMHLVYGAVLGLVVSYGLRPAATTRTRTI